MRAYNVVLFAGKKRVGVCNNLLATNKEAAERIAVKRYKDHWGLAPSVCIIGLVAEKPAPKIGEKMPLVEMSDA